MRDRSKPNAVFEVVLDTFFYRQMVVRRPTCMEDGLTLWHGIGIRGLGPCVMPCDFFKDKSASLQACLKILQTSPERLIGFIFTVISTSRRLRNWRITWRN